MTGDAPRVHYYDVRIFENRTRRWERPSQGLKEEAGQSPALSRNGRLRVQVEQARSTTPINVMAFEERYRHGSQAMTGPVSPRSGASYFMSSSRRLIAVHQSGDAIDQVQIHSTHRSAVRRARGSGGGLFQRRAVRAPSAAAARARGPGGSARPAGSARRAATAARSGGPGRNLRFNQPRLSRHSNPLGRFSLPRVRCPLRNRHPYRLCFL